MGHTSSECCLSNDGLSHSRRQSVYSPLLSRCTQQQDAKPSRILVNMELINFTIAHTSPLVNYVPGILWSAANEQDPLAVSGDVYGLCSLLTGAGRVLG